MHTISDLIMGFDAIENAIQVLVKLLLLFIKLIIVILT